MKHSTANLNELLMLIGYIRVAAQQESAAFKYDNYQEWADWSCWDPGLDRHILFNKTCIIMYIKYY